MRSRFYPEKLNFIPLSIIIALDEAIPISSKLYFLDSNKICQQMLMTESLMVIDLFPEYY